MIDLFVDTLEDGGIARLHAKGHPFEASLLEQGEQLFASQIGADTVDKNPRDMVKLIGRAELGRVEKFGHTQALIGSTRLISYHRVPSFTAAYVISREGAAKLLASRRPFGRPIDVDLRYWWESGLQIKGVLPAAVGLDESSQQSSIGKKSADNLLTKWRKFRLKACYTALNAWHSRRASH